MDKKQKLDNKLGRYNADAFTNSQSGMGMAGLDKSMRTYFAPPTKLDPITLNSMYRFDWLTRKICDKPANDAIKKDIEINSDDSIDLLHDFRKHKVKERMKTVISWARLHGGAALIPVLRDGLESTDPLSIEKIEDIVDVLVFDRNIIQPSGFESDVNSSDYLNPEFYQVNNVKWHHSRVFIVKGCDLSFYDNQSESGWGGSVIDACIPAIEQLASSYTDIRHLLTESSIGILKIPNLTIENTGAGSIAQKILARLNEFNSNKSIYRSAALDKEEEFDFVNRSFSGIKDVLETFNSQISAASNMPSLILFGTGKGGLNSSQKEEMEVYFDDVESIQEFKLTSIVQFFIDAFSNIRQIESPAWEFAPLQQLSSQDKADIRLKDAQSLVLEADVMDLTADEARDLSKKNNISGLFDGLKKAEDLGFGEDDDEFVNE